MVLGDHRATEPNRSHMQGISGMVSEVRACSRASRVVKTEERLLRALTSRQEDERWAEHVILCIAVTFGRKATEHSHSTDLLLLIHNGEKFRDTSAA